MAMPADNGNGRVTKPLSDTVKALSGTPMLLVLVVVNLLVLGMVTYLAKARSDVMQEELKHLLQALSDCARHN